MKNIILALVTAILVCALVTAVVGCSAKPHSDDTLITVTTKAENTDTTEDTDATDGVGLPAAIADIEILAVPTLANTGWELAGGMADGIEMDGKDLQTILTDFGGRMEFIFADDTAVMLSNGESSLESTYQIAEDNVVHMHFEEYSYQAVFTDVEGNMVMIVVNNEDPNSALYFLPIAEE
ncbi:MAG: hypothetical protein E7552_06035 [Ruminococcaceae bacterium]|nr:hypothetical protein [Oscillospiraceae bacterium]